MSTLFERLVDKETLAEQNPVVNRRMLDHWLTANIAGFRDRCAVKIGRRVLLDREAVDEWLEQRRSGNGAK